MRKLFTAIVRILAVGGLVTIAGTAIAQQAFPSKPIRIVTPFPPGGTTTILARLLAQKLTESWSHQVIVDNRGGGNTIIGTEFVAKSQPDGYVLLVTTIAHVVTPLLLPTPYDAIRDFAPVASLTNSELMLLLHPSVPAANLREFIALAKSKPGQLNYASAGSGGIQHLVSEYFNIMTGVKIQHIPYKGSGPALTDLIGGQVHLYFSGPALSMPHIKTGKLRAVAITGETRFPALPQVPTFTEAGLPGFDVKSWLGVLAPVGTPKEIVDKLAGEIARILVMPDVTEKLSSQGLDPFISTPDQYAALMRSETAKYAKIIKSANIKME